MRRTMRLAVLLLAATAGLLLLAAPAGAHTELEASTPVDGAVLPAAPTVVRLVFNEPVSAPLASVVVVGPDGVNRTDGVPSVQGAVVTQRLAALPAAGRYTVAYRVVSDDGHPVSGTLEFLLQAVASASGAVVSVPPPSLEPLAASAPAPRGRSWVLPVAVGAALLGVAGGAGATAAARRRKEPARTGEHSLHG